MIKPFLSTHISFEQKKIEIKLIFNVIVISCYYIFKLFTITYFFDLKKNYVLNLFEYLPIH